jgi:hypothetical protein
MAKRSWVGAWGGLCVGMGLAACGSDDAGDNDNAVAPAVREAGNLNVVPLSPPSGSASDDSESPAAASAGPAYGGADGRSPSATPSATAAGASASSEDAAGVPAPVAPSEPPLGNGANGVEPGTLTAGAWDDSRNLDRFLAYQAELEQAQVAGLPPFDEQAQRDAAERAAQATAHLTLDIALVIDTTGSMGDELAYLQSEFDALSTSIEAQYPQAEQRWALVVYRDAGDDYVTRSFDFEAAGISFRDSLRAQSADGGGDYPEASDAGLAAMNQLSWRSDPDTARLAFWVGDAPHHIDKAAALAAAVDVAASQDVHLYPVASSGVDELTEYSMRSAAQLTLGRYLFLTDDSGVGGTHKEPTIPCYFVTRLDDAILRMVDIEMSGVYHEPAAAEVVRSGGDPADGACTLQSGQTVFAF